MLPANVPIWLATVPVDLHWSFDRLVGIVRACLGEEPKAGLFVFLNRRADKAKVLFHDQSGWCLLYKRLDRGVFPRPDAIENGAVSVQLSVRQLQLMLAGTSLAAPRRLATPASKKNAPLIH